MKEGNKGFYYLPVMLQYSLRDARVSGKRGKRVMKIYKVLGLLVMSAVFLAAASYLLLHAGGWAAGCALDRGFSEEHAVNIGLMTTASFAFIITSDLVYGKIRNFLAARLRKEKSFGYSFYVSAKMAVEILMALPKRSILFSFYLFFIVLELMGLIDKAKDYSVVAIFIVSVDRITKIWPQEFIRLREFGRKIKKDLGRALGEKHKAGL